MITSELFEYAFNCLAQHGKVIFGYDEVKAWPDGIHELFIKQGFLKQVQPAQSLECQGCEENCFMPVNVFLANNKEVKAFIACDKRKDIGLVSVNLNRLTQWQITEEILAIKLTQLIGLSQGPKKSNKKPFWSLGFFKRKKTFCEIILWLESTAYIKVADEKIPLQELIKIELNKLTIDKKILDKFINNACKRNPHKKYQSNMAKREAKKLATQEQHKAWQKAYKQLKKKHPDKSDVWYSQQIAKQDIANGKNAETIRKNMKS